MNSLTYTNPHIYYYKTYSNPEVDAVIIPFADGNSEATNNVGVYQIQRIWVQSKQA